MCWYSTRHAGTLLQAEAGQRLVFREMHGLWNWAIRESDLKNRWPVPVCLAEGTCALFRLTASQQKSLGLPAEAEAVFRMIEDSQKDVFTFANGRNIHVNEFPRHTVFDVLYVPGSERISALLQNLDSATATLSSQAN